MSRRTIQAVGLAVLFLVMFPLSSKAAPNYYTDGSTAEAQQDGWAAWQSQPSEEVVKQSTSSRRSRSSKSSKQSGATPNYYYDQSGNYHDHSPQQSQASSRQSNSEAYQVDQNTYSTQNGQHYQGYEQAYSAPTKTSFLKRILSGGRQQATYQQVSRSPMGGEQVGKASWYGKGFHGGKTANGERYDMNSMTAAHRSLPFGTVIKVTNLNNGRECVVRINNRGPYIGGRILDMSRAAANQLGFVSRGVASVKMQIIGRS